VPFTTTYRKGRGSFRKEGKRLQTTPLTRGGVRRGFNLASGKGRNPLRVGAEKGEVSFKKGKKTRI